MALLFQYRDKKNVPVKPLAERYLAIPYSMIGMHASKPTKVWGALRKLNLEFVERVRF